MASKKITLSYPVKVVYSTRFCKTTEGKKVIFEDVDVVTVDVNENVTIHPIAYKVIKNVLLIKARRFRKEVLKEDVHSVNMLETRVIDNPYIK